MKKIYIAVAVIVVLTIGFAIKMRSSYKAPSNTTKNQPDLVTRTEPPLIAAPPATDTKPTAPANTPAPTPTPTPNQKIITVTGVVMSKSSNTLITPPFSFVLNATGKIYIVVLDNATSKNTIVINSRNEQVGNNFIQVANTVTVTGTLTGSTLNATVIQVQTTKDEGA